MVIYEIKQEQKKKKKKEERKGKETKKEVFCSINKKQQDDNKYRIKNHSKEFYTITILLSTNDVHSIRTSASIFFLFCFRKNCIE